MAHVFVFHLLADLLEQKCPVRIISESHLQLTGVLFTRIYKLLISFIHRFSYIDLDLQCRILSGICSACALNASLMNQPHFDPDKADLVTKLIDSG